MAHRSTTIAMTRPAAMRAGGVVAGGLGIIIMTTTTTMPPGAGVD